MLINWLSEAVFYQIYPLGFCEAPKENDQIAVPRILKVIDWIPHIKDMGFNAIYFAPVFQSDRHGYDTRNYRLIDDRLGQNNDFARVCHQLRAAGIRVVLDGVFNHVGRGFWAFQDVLQNREQSKYLDWFYIQLHQDNGYRDGLSYEGWEGHFELVKLNLQNPEVREYLFDSIRVWVEEFGIDGLRLDVAYCLDLNFLKELRQYCDGLKEDFCLIGEVLFGDYNRIVQDDLCHSCTNYECYKGLYSSFNDKNLFEIDYSLNRQFCVEKNAIYAGKMLFSFVDNHDVTRIASILNDKKHLSAVYTILFTMPGIPCVYYGSEWGAEGKKENQSDDGLRPSFKEPIKNELSNFITTLIQVRKSNEALRTGSYRTLGITNRQLIFERHSNEQSLIIGINADDVAFRLHVPVKGRQKNLFTEEVSECEGFYDFAPYETFIFELIK